MGKSNIVPDYPTQIRRRYTDGQARGLDKSMWLLKKVPLETIVEARSEVEILDGAAPLLSAFEELATMAPIGASKRRVINKSKYRQVQLLLVNVPALYEPPREHPNRDYLRRNFSQRVTSNRVLFLAVQLKDQVGGGGGAKAIVDSVISTLVESEAPLEDYSVDFRRVDAAMTRSGLMVPSTEEVRLANSWWNHGGFADTPVLPHGDHIHYFGSSEAVRISDAMGRSNCNEWGELPDTSAFSFVSVEDFEFGFAQAESSRARWAADMVSAGARAISVRGFVEPAAVTRDELRRQRKRILDDITERAQNNKLERSEQIEEEHLVAQIEGVYGNGGGTPTLIDASVLIAFDGVISDIEALIPDSAAKLAHMTHRQPAAWEEMKLCSNVRANPNLQDLPVQDIACSAIQSLSMVGDASGALPGFTEEDNQPAYIAPEAASKEDSYPITVCAGATGSGKTMLMLELAIQMSKERPQVLIDPKPGSDHSAVVEGAGGLTVSLDDLRSENGIFDPIRFSANRDSALELATSVLAYVDPWGGRARDYEVDLLSALEYGISHGADCIGIALRMAQEAGKASSELVDPVFRLVGSSPMFRAFVGTEPGGHRLGMDSQLTLIKVGDAHLNLPEPGTARSEMDVTQRISVAMVRQMVFGSSAALMQRGGGVVHLDEAWVFLGAGKTEVDRLGRLARSQNVLPILYTQKVSDAVKAEIQGFISRGFILPLDKVEAKAACELFGLEPTSERMNRITAKRYKSDASKSPNWDSMFALKDAATGKVLRGTIGIHIDLAGRAVPIEITLSDEFLKLASTTPDAVAKRKRERRGVEADLTDRVA